MSQGKRYRVLVIPGGGVDGSRARTEAALRLIRENSARFDLVVASGLPLVEAEGRVTGEAQYISWIWACEDDGTLPPLVEETRARDTYENAAFSVQVALECFEAWYGSKVAKSDVEWHVVTQVPHHGFRNELAFFFRKGIHVTKVHPSGERLSTRKDVLMAWAFIAYQLVDWWGILPFAELNRTNREDEKPRRSSLHAHPAA